MQRRARLLLHLDYIRISCGYFRTTSGIINQLDIRRLILCAELIFLKIVLILPSLKMRTTDLFYQYFMILTHRSLLYFLLVIPLLSFGQEPLPGLEKLVDIPKITHFSRTDFEADAQFWTMTEDQDGIRYFGNNDGALVFDGKNWQKVKLPNNSSVRSLLTTDDNKVYAGGFNEIGVIEKDSLGIYNYRSLLADLKLENEKLENLWQVHQFKDFIIYRSFNELVVISGNTATHIASNNAFIHSGIVNGRFLVQDIEYGIFEFSPESMQLKLRFENSSLQNNSIVGFFPDPQDPGVVTLVARAGEVYKANLNSGEVHKWISVFDGKFRDEIISAVKHQDSYLLGTLGSKIILLTGEGEVVQKPHAFAQVYDSSILNFYQEQGNIWVLLNNGLDYIEFDSPVSLLFDEASIYDILVEQEHIYVATNKGVYFSRFPAGEAISSFQFHKVPGIDGQAWSVQKAEGEIIIGHDKGLFLLRNFIPQKIGEESGFWKITPIKEKPGSYLASNYNGLYLVTSADGNWKISHKIRGFEESARDILPAAEKNTYWVCHGYKGVYKLKIDEDYSRVFALDHYTDQNGFSSPFNINVFHWKGNTVFTTNNGIYTFEEQTNSFVPFAPLNRVLGTSENTRKLLENGNRTWFVLDDEIGYFDGEPASAKTETELFLNLKGNLNRGMESLVPIKNGKTFIGAITGLYLYNTQRSPAEEAMKTSFGRISTTQSDTESLLPLLPSEGLLELEHTPELMRFEFSSPELSPSATVQFQYYLEGLDRTWSAWETASFKEYTHLQPGEYTFRVRSRDLTGNLGEEASYSFSIAPVWYQTNLFIFLSISGFILGLGLIGYFINLKIKRDHQKSLLASQRAQKLLELEIEQLRLQQDKDQIKKDKLALEEDNISKSKELANYTMLLVKKKDIFSETYSNLKELKNTLKSPTAKKQLQDILIQLHQHRIGEEYMNIFDVNFERVHRNFFERLKEINPKITHRELRLLAFVNMDLTNKEIAPLLNISVRGVETARYRVRKKLDVHEENLLEFLQNISEPEVAEG